MLKTKRFNIALVAMVIFSLVAMYGIIPTAKAASLDMAKDTISDSDLGATEVTHTIIFNTGVDLTTGTVISVTFNSNFDVIDNANLSCPSDSAEGGADPTMTCTVDTELSSTTDYTIELTGATNPGTAGYYDVTISHDQAGAAEEMEIMVYILEDVTVTAHVDATLTFAVGTTTPSDTINGVSVTATSSPNEISFGTLDVDTRYVMGHTLAVVTNASDGFVVTVEQDQSLQSAAGADIDSFSTTTAALWATLPSADITDEKTWGQIGVTSDDDDAGLLGTGFGADEYVGLDGTNKLVVFEHDGPANGSTEDAGLTRVGYSLQISALQEAGDYQNALTYICTPTY